MDRRRIMFDGKINEMKEWRKIGEKISLENGEKFVFNNDRHFTEFFIVAKAGSVNADNRNFAVKFNSRLFTYTSGLLYKSMREIRVRIEKICDYVEVITNAPANHQTGMQSSSSYFQCVNKFNEEIDEIEICITNDEFLAGTTMEIFAR